MTLWKRNRGCTCSRRARSQPLASRRAARCAALAPCRAALAWARALCGRLSQPAPHLMAGARSSPPQSPPRQCTGHCPPLVMCPFIPLLYVPASCARPSAPLPRPPRPGPWAARALEAAWTRSRLYASEIKRRHAPRRARRRPPREAHPRDGPAPSIAP
ncbi:MAG: hypothetical protein J3K34DRAFT_419998 [Monoraphidium minutum]|nr:MAG: hypothetical protein J3K34DRAFT_419998 [Monoraphidium minutum]